MMAAALHQQNSLSLALLLPSSRRCALGNSHRTRGARDVVSAGGGIAVLAPARTARSASTPCDTCRGSERSPVEAAALHQRIPLSHAQVQRWSADAGHEWLNNWYVKSSRIMQHRLAGSIGSGGSPRPRTSRGF